MSKLEKLIQEYCSNGVEYVQLEKIADIGTGSCNTNEATEDGCFPFYVRSQEPLRINKYQFDETAIITAGDGVGVGKVFHLVKGKYALHQRAYRIHLNTKDVLHDFLFHYMKATFYDYIMKNLFHGSVASIRRPMLNSYPIPVPPLPVQEEIVRILDSFTQLTAELQDKLQDELQARKKQYEYYRKLVLDKNDSAQWVPLLSVSDTFTGLTYKPTDTSTTGTIVLRSSNIKNSRLVYEDNVFVQIDKIPSRAIVQENDILICARNGSKALIGKAAMIPSHSSQMAFGAFMTVLRAKECINPRYLFFVWQSPRIQNMIHGDSGMPINQITKKMLEQIRIPLLPMEQQDEIVALLSRFDEYSNSISSGLPAEIAARKKQYEYYRDKLLSFKEVKV